MKKLYIEPTSYCNLDCKMCFRHTWFDEEFCDLPLDAFEKVMDTMPKTVKTIFFGGMGEPFCHKDIFKMLKKAKDKAVNVEILTNATLLDEEKIKLLFSMNIDKLWLSIDAFSKNNADVEGHNNVQNIFDFLSIFNRLRSLFSAKIKLGIAFVATKINVNELKNLPYFIDRYRVDDVNISNIYPSNMDAFNNSLYKKTLSMSLGSDKFASTRPTVNLPYMDFDLPEVQDGVKGLFSRMNFSLKVGGIDVPRRSQYCKFVQEGNCFVRADGDVSPCMNLLHSGKTVLEDLERTVYHHSFGNVKEKSLQEIWDCKEYAEFRERVIEFSFPPCLNCGHCHYPEANLEDCFGNEKPTCGACLWSDGLLSCP